MHIITSLVSRFSLSFSHFFMHGNLKSKEREGIPPIRGHLAMVLVATHSRLCTLSLMLPSGPCLLHQQVIKAISVSHNWLWLCWQLWAGFVEPTECTKECMATKSIVRWPRVGRVPQAHQGMGDAIFESKYGITKLYLYLKYALG